MGENCKYLIKTNGKYLNLIVKIGSLKHKALAVFTSEEKAQKHIADVAHLYSRTPEQVGQVVSLTEQQFRDVLNDTLARQVNCFWEDPTSREPVLMGPAELEVMKFIIPYLDSDDKSASDQNGTAA